jgi:hypothetical protein
MAFFVCPINQNFTIGTNVENGKNVRAKNIIKKM